MRGPTRSRTRPGVADSSPPQPRLDRAKAVPIRQYGIHNFAEVIEKIRFEDLGDPVVLDLRTIHFVRPSLLVLLRAYVDLLSRGDKQLGITPRQVWAMDPVSKRATGYMQAMNLYGQIKPTDDDAAVQQHLPLQRLDPLSDTDEPASRLKKIILGQLPQGKDTGLLGTALAITLAELLENFARHSESGRVGWVCAQYYRGRTYRETKARAKPRTREDAIEIAVADTGIGIAKSLSTVEEHRRAIMDAANPCELATEMGVTGKPGVHSGYRLYVAKRLCERNDGVFKLASGNHWFKSDRGRSECGNLRNAWPGTFVALRLSLQRDLDVNKTYEEMEPLEVMR